MIIILRSLHFVAEGFLTSATDAISAPSRYAIHRFKQETVDIDKQLIFEEKPVAVEVLDLGDSS